MKRGSPDLPLYMHWPERWWPRDHTAGTPIRNWSSQLRPTLLQRFQADWHNRFEWPRKKPRRISHY